MVLKRLRRKGDAASAPPPKSAAASAPPPKSSAPGSTKSDKVKKKGVKPDPKKLFKKKGVKPDPKKLKGSCIESAGIAEASASAPTPAPKPVETKPAVAAAGTAVDRPALSKTEDKKATRKETMKGREEKKGEGSNGNTGDRKVMKGREEKVEGEGSKTSRKETVKGREEKGEGEGKKMSRKETVKGREEKGEGSGSKTSRKEMMEGREEERMKREEKRRKTTGKEKEEEESGSGFIFMCSARTKPECYRNGVFGLPRGKMDVVEKIRPGVKLFLYDFDLKLMYGVYKADTRGGLDIVRHAFDGKFPAQVKFSVDLDCLPIPESSFKHAIKENYTSKGRFTQELSSKQVQRLLALFQPIGLSQPAPQHIEEVGRSHIVEVEDRRKPSYDEERRQLRHIEEMSVPINHHAYALGDDYMIARSLRRPLLDEPRRSLVLDPYHIQESHHAPPTYYHQVATSSPYHQPHMDIMHERTAAEATVRDPLVARDYGALPGELAARSERVDELYRSYKLSTSALDLNPRPSYGATYEYPTSVYREGSQRPVVTRVNGPSVPVSTRYSFAGPPAY